MSLVGSALFAAPYQASEHDFLTADEIDQVREAQEPNARLQLYTQFARQRIALVEQLVSKEKSGRSGMIHDTLEDYQKIIEAIDTVADDALKRQTPINEGVAAVASAEKQMLASLQKIQGMTLPDMSRFDFALEQAVGTTQDSIDLASEDLGARSTEVAAKGAREKKQREESMSEGELAASKDADKKAAEKKRKAPTLLKPGETEQVPH